MRLSRTAKRRLLLLTCIVFVVVGAAATAYVVRKQRIRAQYAAWREEGMNAAAASDHAKVVDLLGRYMQRYPEDADALATYAKSRPLVKAPNRRHLYDTMMVLRYLVSLRPDLLEQKRELLRLYGQYGYATEAITLANDMLKGSQADGEIFGIRATSLARAKRLNEALADANKWVELSPNEIDAPLLAIELHKALASPRAQADQLAQRVADQMSEKAGVKLVQARVESTYGSAQNAARILEEVVQLKVNDAKIRRQLVATFDALERQDRALAVLKQLVEEFGAADERKDLVRRLWESGRWDDALKYAAPLTQAQIAEDTEFQGMIAAAYANSGKREEAKKTIAAMRSQSQDAASQAWASVVEMSMGAAASAPATAPAAAPAPAGARPILAPTSAAAPREIVERCNSALRENPNSPYLHCFLGDAYAAMGEPETAIAQYQRAAQSTITWVIPLMRLSDTYLAQGRHEPAVEVAFVALRRAPSSPQTAIQLAIAWNASIDAKRRSDNPQFQSFVKDILQKLPSSEHILLPERVAVLCREGKKDEAKQFADKALASSPPPAAATLHRLAGASRAHGLALEEKCYALVDAGGSQPATALSRAIGVYVDGKRDEAMAHFEKSRANAPNSQAPEWRLAHVRLLDLLQDPAAAQRWRELADEQPDNVHIQQAVLSARTARSDRQLIDRAIERVRKQMGNEGVQWRIARARWLLEGMNQSQHTDARPAEEASRLLTEAINTAPDSVEPRFLQAVALDRMNNSGAALEHIAAVIRLDPGNQAARLFQARLFEARGDLAKAHEAVEHMIQAGQLSDAQRRQTAEILARSGDPAQALKLLEGVQDPTERGDLLRATLYRRQGNVQRTEELCTKLLQKPDLQSVAFAIDFYASQGKQEQAAKALELLKTLKLEPGVEQLVRASHAAAIGRADDALNLLKEATRLAPANPNTWRTLISRYLESGKVEAAQAAVRQAAAAIPADRHFAALSASFPLLIKAAANPSLKPLIIAMAGNAEMKGTKEALALMTSPAPDLEAASQQLMRLKQLADQHAQNLPLQLFTAERFFTDKQYDAAASLANRAAHAFPLSSDAPRLAARSFLAAHRWSDAAGAAKAWRERETGAPGEADFVAAYAMLMAAQPAPARDQLAAHFPGALASPDRNAELIALYAAALHRSGKPQDAEKLLNPLLPNSESLRAAWTSGVVRYLPKHDAAAWLHRLRKLPANGGKDSATEQLQLANAFKALGSNPDDPALKGAAREIRDQLAQRQDLPAVAWAALASLAEEDGDLQQADRLYRRALEVLPDYPVVKNNLAMVLKKRGGDLAQALTLASQAVESNPRFPNFRDTLAEVLDARGETQRAVEQLRIAAAQEPLAPLWQFHLAKVLFKSGNTAEAAKLVHMLARNPGTKSKLDATTFAEFTAFSDKLKSANKPGAGAGTTPVSSAVPNSAAK